MGGTLDYSLDHYWKGNAKKEFVDQQLIMAATALAKLHALTSSYQLSKTDLFLTPTKEGIGLDFYWNPTRILVALSAIELVSGKIIDKTAFLDKTLTLQAPQTVFSLVG